MYTKEQIKELINNAHKSMEKSRDMFGKEIHQKRFKPVYEGYITALCTILDMSDEETTEELKRSSQ